MRLRRMVIGARIMLLEFRGSPQTDDTRDNEAGSRTS